MKKLLPWLAVLVLLAVTYGTIYAAVQQVQRSDANYPQLQLAEDTAASLNRGESPIGLVTGAADISKSLAPFTIVYDKSGHFITGSGYLDGNVPQAPIGVLKASTGKTYSAVTWQPKKGVRIAAVTVSAKNYYVLSGRSLKEVENNENHTMQIALLGGIVALMLLGMIYVLSALSEGY